MGRMREVCGAVSGMFMVAGLKFGDFDPTDLKKRSTLFRFFLYRGDIAISPPFLPILPTGEKKKHLIFTKNCAIMEKTVKKSVFTFE